MLPASAIRFRRNGIEFHTAEPIPTWTEMTVDLQSPREARKMHCTGIVVDCQGNRHSGYSVSMLFVNLSRQSQQQLSQLAHSQLA